MFPLDCRDLLVADHDLDRTLERNTRSLSSFSNSGLGRLVVPTLVSSVLLVSVFLRLLVSFASSFCDSITASTFLDR